MIKKKFLQKQTGPDNVFAPRDRELGVRSLLIRPWLNSRLLIIAIFFFNFFYYTDSTAQSPQAWQIIFDGKTFNGWTIVDSPANVVIIDSAFIIHMTKNTSRHAFIQTNKKYKDFILELDCRRDTLFDSGIMFRASVAPDTSRVGLYGYMVKIDPSLTRRWTGGIFFDYGNYIEWMYSLAEDSRAQSAERVGEWNHYRVEAIGSHIKVWINDIPVTNMNNTRYREGSIALKIHYLNGTHWNEKMSASFRNIRIISSRPEKYIRDMDIPVKEVNAGKITYY